MCFIIDLGIDGCIYPPCVSNELDQYLSEPLFAQNLCIIDAPEGGEIFSTVALIFMLEQTCRYRYVLFQMSEKIGKNRNFGAKIGINRKWTPCYSRINLDNQFTWEEPTVP